MSIELKRCARFVVAAAVILFLVDAILGWCLRYLERNMRGGERARTYYAAYRADADVFVFGSSRALYHYNPGVMTEVLGMTVYNAGRSAQTVLYHTPLLKMILKRHRPKLVVLDINENEFVRDQQKYDIVNYLLPYYGEAAVRDIVDEVKPSYRYFAWSKSLPYNSSMISMLWRTVRPETGGRSDGFAPVFGHRSKGDSLVDNCRARVDIDERIVTAFDDFLLACRNAKVPVLIVISPRYTRFLCDRAEVAKISKEATKWGVQILDFSQSGKFQSNPQWMYDVAHLNSEGATEFSRDVASFLIENGYADGRVSDMARHRQSP